MTSLPLSYQLHNCSFPEIVFISLHGLLTKKIVHVLDLLSSLYVSTDLYRHQGIAGVRIRLSLHQIKKYYVKI
jgi:hypothetical protein